MLSMYDRTNAKKINRKVQYEPTETASSDHCHLYSRGRDIPYKGMHISTLDGTPEDQNIVERVNWSILKKVAGCTQ